MPASTPPPDRQIEAERKFDLAPDAELPAVGDLVTVGQGRVHHLRAVYLDTPDLLLIRNRITLRRREGGSDEGWHLKLPAEGRRAEDTEDHASGTRWELHAPLVDGPGRWVVPGGHLAALAERLGQAWEDRSEAGQGLVPVAVLTTDRLEIDLHPAAETDDTETRQPDAAETAGQVLAVLCDDTVRAEPAGSTWRELEVELVAGDEALLDTISERFRASGVPVSDAPSKLSRALGDRPERAAAGLAPDVDGPASAVLLAYLAEQVAVIRGRDTGLRADAPEMVHKTRVACRRLRSALRTFRRLLDREVTDPLRQELRWYGEVLGGPRDAEVQKANLLAELELLPEDLVEGPVRERVTTELDRRHADAHAALVEVMDTDRYAALQDRLVELVAQPPWRGRARKKARTVLPPLVDKAVARARRDWAAAQEAEGRGDPQERMHLLHETRKRAKAVRYAWEALAPSFGDDAAQSAAAWEQVTEHLGAVQDSVVAVTWLRELMAAAEDAGEPTHTYGVLIGMQLGLRRPATQAGEGAVRAALGRDPG